MVHATLSQLARTGRPAIGLALALCLGAARAEADDSPAAPTLSGVGANLESTLALPPAERGPALVRVQTSLDAAMKKGLDDDQKRIAYLLSGEIRYQSGDYVGALDSWRKAEKELRKTPFADDASLSAICALEATGADQEAAEAWATWEAENPQSPLLPEARLARCWNALRRGDAEGARASLDALAADSPWMEQDGRTILARATLACREGRPEEGIALLENRPEDPARTYLLAACRNAAGQTLKAAALYQEVAVRYPDSPYRDAALLAKANTFLSAEAYDSARDEFTRTAETATDPRIRAEAQLRAAASAVMAQDREEGTRLLREVAATHAGTPVAARAQFLLGEVLYERGEYDQAIAEFNQLLTRYFDHELAATAQYRVGRCLDALGREGEATSTYMAVVSGYSQTSEAPAAAYLAGAGLLKQNRPRSAAPYFQLVLDRYAQPDTNGTYVFDSPAHRELTEASLCLLELSYHRAGDLGQLSGVPHQMLQGMPPSESPWRAYALLIDADALAAQSRFEEAQAMLEQLIGEFPDLDVSMHANRLLAWTYARQGKDELAISTEERMLARYAADGNPTHLSSAYLNKAHVLFNRKDYKGAAAAYNDYLNRFPGSDAHLLALYQAGLCYLRLDRGGDAADRWETLLAMDPSAPISEKAWVRAGDLYFQAEHYEDANRCYQGLLENFAGSDQAALGMLRMAQCDYNAGRNAEALDRYSELAARYPGTREAKEAERGIEQALYRLGQEENGAEILSQLVERYPTSSFAGDAQFGVAMARYEAKEYDAAAEEFRRVISQFPGYSAADRAQFLMADSYAQAGATEDARLAFEQFLMFFPDSDLRPTVQFRLGAYRFEKGEYMRAAVDFTGVLETETEPDVAAAALFNLALCQRMLGSDAEARASLDRYRSLYGEDERSAVVSIQLADLNEKDGNTQGVVDELMIAINGDYPPERKAELAYRLGAAREELEDTEGATRAYRLAMRAQPKSDPFRLSAVARLAALYEKEGESQKALSAYRDLVENAQDPELVAAAEERLNRLGGTSQ